MIAPWHDVWQGIPAAPRIQQRLDVPGRLLSEYFRERHRSQLGKILTAANAWPDWCETVVLIAPPRDAAAAAAMFAAAAHPFYNQLSAGGRGGRPRLHILEPTLDHDRLQAALDLLKPSGDADAAHQRWALAVAGSETEHVAATAAPFVAALRGDAARHFVLGDSSIATALTAWDAPPFFEPAALLASSTVGADVVQQLKGAVWFMEQAKTAPPAENEAIQLAEFLAHDPTEIVVWHGALEQPARNFARQVSREVRILNGCELASQASLLAAHQPVRRLHLWSESIRRDRLGAAEPMHADGEPYPDVAIERFVPTPQPLVSLYEEVRAAESAADVVSAEIRLSRLGDPALGELSAWFSAAILLKKSLA